MDRFEELHNFGRVVDAGSITRAAYRSQVAKNDGLIDIIEEGFDLAIRIGRLRDSRMIARRGARVMGIIAASRECCECHGRPSTIRDLAKHRGLLYSLISTTCRYCAANGRPRSVRVPLLLQTNNGDYILEAAVTGLGMMKQPKYICHEAVQAGLLEPVLTSYQWIDFLAGLWGDCPYWEDC